MLPFRVRRFKERQGEEVVLLLTRGGEPYFYANAFVTGDYRNTGKSPNTCDKVLRSIGMAIMWGDSVGRSLDQDLADGQFLTYSEADDLARFLSLSAREQIAECQASLAPTKRKRGTVLNLEAFRPNPSDPKEEAGRTVPDQEFANRLRWVAKFAEWHLKRRVDSLAMQGRESDQLKSLGDIAIARLRELAPAVDGFIDDDQTLEAPDVGVIQTIDDILHPESKENPFSSDFIKHRNFVIWRLLRDTGARRAEIQAVKSIDVTINPPRLEIKHAKGNSQRTVAFRRSTAVYLDNYIMSHWAALPQGSMARKRGFLFCDEKGRHLSLRAINRIFEAARGLLGKQPQNITPHAMRRFWNHLFSLEIDNAPVERRPSPEKEAQMRTRIMGWSTDNQAKRYNRRHIREAADKITQDMMNRLEQDQEEDLEQ
jgi:integrase